MSNQNYSDMSSLSEPLLELQRINKEASEKMIRECISFCSDASSVAVKYLQTMPRVTSPEDFASTHLKLVSQQGEKVLEYTQNIFQIFQDALKEQGSWVEEKLNTAIKTTSSAAHKSKKSSEG